MKMKKKIDGHKVYEELQKRKKHIRNRAFLMAGLMLAINTFAWFTFVANGNGHLSADVISWDIQFFDDDSQVEILDIELIDLYPGMDDFHKSITIRNQSDLNAIFTYRIEEVTIYGEKYVSDDYSASFLSDFPFKIGFNYVTNQLDIGESLSFDVDVTWPFESTDEYCKLNSLYPYINGINYYKLNGTNYDNIAISNGEYQTSLESGLYAECDDVDSYWGEKNVIFKKDNPNSNAINIKIKLIVSQRED